MALISEHVEGDTRDRILEVAERLFRQIGYQKTTVGDIAKELKMSPANVYRFFQSKKEIHQAVALSLLRVQDGDSPGGAPLVDGRGRNRGAAHRDEARSGAGAFPGAAHHHPSH